MSEKPKHVPYGKLATTKGLYGRARRYATDPEMEPVQSLTDTDLLPLAAMMDETDRLGRQAFEHVRRPEPDFEKVVADALDKDGEHPYADEMHLYPKHIVTLVRRAYRHEL